MSLFGKNIKKIRSVKGLSQQAFAELFDLKRGTLGAYEEGRSEPKIDTILKIANYFSIQLEDLLVNELTVNSLLKFKGDFSVVTQETNSDPLASIPYINESMASDYIRKHTESNFIDLLPRLQLPINTEKTFRGYAVTNLEMTTHDHGFYPNDIMIGEQVPISILKKLNNGILVFAVTTDKILLRRLYSTKNQIILRADHKSIEDEAFAITELKEVWRVRYVFCKRIPEFSEGLDTKIDAIEKELSKMKERLDH